MTPERKQEIRKRLEAATNVPLQPYYLINKKGDFQNKEEMLQTLENMINDTLAHGDATNKFWGVQNTDATGRHDRISVCLTMNGPTSEANAHFIAHAPTDIADLLEDVERLQETLEAYERAASSVNEALNTGDGSYKP